MQCRSDVTFQTVLWRISLVPALVVGLSGCPSAAKEPQPSAANSKGAKGMKIEVTSTAFGPGKPIPKKYTGEGADVSPPLSWHGVPEGTKELALICDDPDAPTKEPWVHWVLYKLPVGVSSLPEGVARQALLQDPMGAVQGQNSWPKGEKIGYGGPMPPPGHGTHHYHFKLYALNAPLDTAEPSLDKTTLLRRMQGHVLAEGELIGTYQR
jgi:Raf kinase inhibitor-like YbhB/YbcL family protein